MADARQRTVSAQRAVSPRGGPAREAGAGSPRAIQARRRRRARYRRRRAMALVLLVSVVGSVSLGVRALLGEGVTRAPAAPLGSTVPGRAAAPPADGSAGTPATSGALQPVPGTQGFARVRGLTLHLPGRRVLAVGYHEAKNPQALPLRPLGRLQRNANRRSFTPVPSTAGPSYVVLKTRYRGTGPTTAVDVAMPVGARVLSPVTGRVRSVRQYLLYGAWVDYRVEIAVRRADLVVVVIHLRTVAVRRGARVVAGVTPIGRPRLLDYRSDIDEFVGRGVPHVHIEVKARRS